MYSACSASLKQLELGRGGAPRVHCVTTIRPYCGFACCSEQNRETMGCCWAHANGGLLDHKNRLRVHGDLGRERQPQAVNGQVAVPVGGQITVPTPRADHFLFRVVPPRARAWRIRYESPSVTTNGTQSCS